MSLSPDDIVGYRFKLALRGYATDEVDELLDRLADQVERADAELAQLRGRAAEAEEASAAAARDQETLRRTLVTAQEAAERTIADAEAQVARLRAEAEAEAGRLRAEAADEAAAVREEAARHAREVAETAQRDAQREAAAARARVEQAAVRHRGVLEGVARSRDALRAQLAQLEELVEAGVPEVPPSGVGEPLVAGELDGGPSEPAGVGGETDADREHEGSATQEPTPGEEPDLDVGPDVPPPTPEAPRGPDGLRVRVHDDATTVAPPLGSDPRGGS